MTEQPTAPTPTMAGLIKATGIALVLAAVLLVFVVLPAEYGVDPTGVGTSLGLTRLANPEEADPAEAAVASDAPEDQVTIEVPPGVGLEYKFLMQEGDKLKFSWTSTAEPLFFDFHGEPEGETDGFFESYSISTAMTAKGTLTAPFTGNHGWYWKNKTGEPTSVTLVTSGTYEILGRR